MKDAMSTQDYVRRLIQGDTKRTRVRSNVDGLVDGNSPFRPEALRAAGRAEACNVNWGTGRSYLESGSGAFYDLFAESPGFVFVQTSHGNEEQQIEWSRIMSELADQEIAENEEFDDDMQLSQNEMTLHGNGPLYFQNEFDVFPMAVETTDLKMPERSRSKLGRWEAATIIFDYYPPELYAFIKDEAAAAKSGWDVEYTKLCIQHAMGIRKENDQAVGWEWYQVQLKTNSLAYYDDTKVIRLAHTFWKEFPKPGEESGRVTHGIVQREDTTGDGTKYLFLKVGRYESFRQCIHPMYFDRGRGGYHHTVTGLGVKMFGPMAYENRLLCNLMDKTFAPKILFKPTSADATQKLQMAHFGDYGVLPAGTEAIQNPIQGFLTDGLAMFRTSSELMRSNLSQYRQTVPMDKQGNPETAFEVREKVSQQGALSNTTFSRYYRQLDSLYSEIIRRMCNLNSPHPIAMRYQDACIKRGVPKECFGRIKSVKAIRVIGQGSPFMRQQVTSELSGIIGGCSEEGQNNWRNDFIASRAGQGAVSRYNPNANVKKMATDQRERAMNQVAGMKIGLPPTLTSTQDPLTFAATFMQACVQAIQSVTQGADMAEVVQFLNIAGPASAAHIRRLSKDPLKKDIVDGLIAQFKRVMSMADKMKAMLQRKAQQQQQQAAATNAALNDEQLKNAKLKGEEQRKNMKTQAQLQRDQAKHTQDLALNDARTASEIELANKRQAAEAAAEPAGAEK